MEFGEWFSRKIVRIAKQIDCSSYAAECVGRELEKVDLLRKRMDFEVLDYLRKRHRKRGASVRTINCVENYAMGVEGWVRPSQEEVTREMLSRKESGVRERPPEWDGPEGWENGANPKNWHGLLLYEEKSPGEVRYYGVGTQEFLGLYLNEIGLIEKV